MTLLDSSGTFLNIPDPIAAAIERLKEGNILAMKGLGGFHIACDAMNVEAVNLLRERKRRSNKPFALMAPDVGEIRKFCFVSPEEEALLLSVNRPIVLLRKRYDAAMPEAVSPMNSNLGFMLPYTPMHHLLFRHPLSGNRPPDSPHFPALIMTSGNISEEPIIIGNVEAGEKLSFLADAFLVHDRDIFMRVDDSVVFVQRGSTQETMEKGTCEPSFVRRARGYTPEPIYFHEDGPDVLGCGADVKNTFTITKGNVAIVSQHIGDMENLETLRFFEETLQSLKGVYRAEPRAMAYDLHPRYLSTRWALDQHAKADGRGVSMLGVQHHYAHIASVMAEHNLKGRVIGVAFDGSGFGGDGTLWGGEFLLADVAGFRRAGHIRSIPLPGGEKAIVEPWRIAVSCVREAAGGEAMEQLKSVGFLRKYGEATISMIMKIAEKRQFSPLSSGAGRLFDAVSALAGICDRNTFEGEASIALESCVSEGSEDEYPVDVHFGDAIELDFSHTVLGILDDVRRHAGRQVIATRFHNSVLHAIIKVVLKLSMMNNIKDVALSGGVFQNRYLRERVEGGLQSEGLAVYANELVPCNDAGISLGQAYIARERMRAGII
jgi:hydrogenase maturation protein HypF